MGGHQVPAPCRNDFANFANYNATPLNLVNIPDPFRVDGSRVLLAPIAESLARPVPTAAMFALEALGIALLANATDSPIFVLGTALIGVGMALTYPLIGAQLASLAGASRGPALTVLGAYVNVGIGVGAAAIGLAADLAGVESALLTAAGITGLAGAMVLIILKTTAN